MSKIKFSKEIKQLIKHRDKVPDEFWVRTDGGKYRVLWFMSRQKPSVEADYSFDEERFGLTREGKVIWGFDSGCSCPSPWSAADFGDDNYHVKEYKEFEVEPETAFDADWQDESYSTLKDFLYLISDNPDPKEVLNLRNAEIRRYMVKRIGYENIKDAVDATVIHTDGDSELLELIINGQKEKYVKVKDSSTDREYLLYVPDHITRCKEGIAWTFDLTEEQYNPIIET